MTNQAYIDKTLDTNLDVKQIMDSWTLKKGYPVIQVDRQMSTSTPNSNLFNTELVIKQKWFLLNPLSKSFSDPSTYNSYKWFVPITFTTKSNASFDFERRPNWLKPSDKECKKNLFF